MINSKTCWLIIGCVITALLLVFACNGEKVRKSEIADLSPESTMAHVYSADEVFLLVGTYTSDEGSKGIYSYRFNLQDGRADSVGMVEVKNPSYLTFSHDERFVYSVGENEEREGQAHAFSFDNRLGLLTLLNSCATKGTGPCHIVTDVQGKSVQTANYRGGNISSFLLQEDGFLSKLDALFSFEGASVDVARQESPHLHCVRYSPDGQYLFAADLGADKLYRITFDRSVGEGVSPLSQSSLREYPTPPGTGPRHFDFHPNGLYLYLLGELSGEVIVYDYHQGDLVQKQLIASDTLGGRGSADIHVSPDGRYLYASNRLVGDGIAIFVIHPDDGTLRRIAYQPTGRHPRNFNITPNGDFLLVACRDDHKIQVFKRSHETGLLSDTKQDILLDKPVCVKFASVESNKENN